MIRARSIQLFVLLALQAIGAHGQDEKGKSDRCGSEGTVFAIVENDPTFPGGKRKMQEFINKEIEFPQEAKEEGISGKVYVSFVVCKSGKISDIEVLKGIGHGCDEEAVRIIKKMPEWEPGRQRGRKVNVKVHIPIEFEA